MESANIKVYIMTETKSDMATQVGANGNAEWQCAWRAPVRHVCHPGQLVITPIHPPPLLLPGTGFCYVGDWTLNNGGPYSCIDGVHYRIMAGGILMI